MWCSGNEWWHCVVKAGACEPAGRALNWSEHLAAPPCCISSGIVNPAFLTLTSHALRTTSLLQVERWQVTQREKAVKEGYVATILGRQRKLPDAKHGSKAAQGHALRAAINTPIQGSAADIATAAMLRIDADEALRDMGWRLLLQVGGWLRRGGGALVGGSVRCACGGMLLVFSMCESAANTKMQPSSGFAEPRAAVANCSLQVHDEVILEGPKETAEQVRACGGFIAGCGQVSMSAARPGPPVMAPGMNPL